VTEAGGQPPERIGLFPRASRLVSKVSNGVCAYSETDSGLLHTRKTGVLTRVTLIRNGFEGGAVLIEEADDLTVDDYHTTPQQHWQAPCARTRSHRRSEVRSNRFALR
jgi:hypothetical protein